MTRDRSIGLVVLTLFVSPPLGSDLFAASFPPPFPLPLLLLREEQEGREGKVWAGEGVALPQNEECQP